MLLFEKCMRGGITHTVKRYVKVNNKYIKDQYNPDEKSTCLQYLEANNCQITQKLPTNVFAWKKVDDFNHEEKIVKKDKKGYIVEVDRYRVSKRAAQEAERAAIFSGENENWKGRKTATTS